MTKQEYIARQKAMTHGMNRRALWGLPALAAIFAIFFSFCFYMDRHPQSAWMGNLIGGGLTALLLGCFLWMLLTIRQHQRDFGVKCRSCGKNIVSSQIAIATGNCGYCGEKLFD